MSALAVQDWRPMLGRVDEVIADLKTNPPPLPVDEIAEAIQFLEWLAADNFTFLGVRDYALDGNDDARAGARDAGSASCAARDVRVLTRGGRAVTITPEIRAFLNEPKPLIVTKANVHVARAPARLYGLRRRQALRRRRQAGRRIPHRRPVHLDRLHALDAQRFRICAARSTPCCAAPASIRTAIPARRWSTCWRPIRATSCSRSTRTRSINFALAILQLDERPRVRVLARRDRFDRFVSVLVYRAARALRQPASARRSATISPRPTTAAFRAFYPYLPGRPAGARAFHHRPRRRPDAGSRPRRRWKSAVAAIVRTWTDGLADALARRTTPARPRALLERYGDAFSAGYRDAYPPATAVADIRMIEALSPERPLGVDFYHRAEDEQRARRPEGLELRPADPAVGARAGAGEHGLPRRRRAHLRHRAARRRRRRLVARHDAGARRRRRRSTSTRARRALEAAS